MQVVILAGGMGTRLGSITETRPKPMVEVGGRPIIWHIMKYFSSFGFNEFVICLGYKGDYIRDFFLNYAYYTSDFTINLANKEIDSTDSVEDWKINLIETGTNSMTGSRIKQVSSYLDGEDFMLTYGDGLCNVDISSLIDFHRTHGKLATLTAVHPIERFGVLEYADDQILSFKEKITDEDTYINGGFMVLSNKVLDYIEDNNKQVVFESDTLKALTERKELMMFKHNDFWQCMDTPRDMLLLNELWESEQAPWKVW